MIQLYELIILYWPLLVQLKSSDVDWEALPISFTQIARLNLLDTTCTTRDWISHQTLTYRRKRRNLWAFIYEAIFRIQAVVEKHGICLNAIIANLYVNYSFRSVVAAMERANLDAREARAIYYEDVYSCDLSTKDASYSSSRRHSKKVQQSAWGS